MEMDKSDQAAQRIIARNKKIIALRRAGMTLLDISKEVGLSKGYVGALLIAADVIIHVRRDGGGGVLGERIERIMPFVRKGMSAREISEHLQISVHTLKRWYGPAKKIAQEENPALFQEQATNPEESPNARSALGGAVLPVGHPIAVDAMWCGLEKYREPLAL
ncbi:hypothetical protein [Acetobacter lambici]|uniref:Uncharacterized protein n=1 Tax=Acetobacter lambici TaxID=1332824 RepID=A0ABT1F022_9PROT|nr:hypothetical protein [Acetobacter lambici]MCP1243020.1 hypothetical protein [Acetobacter lambici]MCP1258530.1 hypothetical protein [Acetobacter lambici]